MVGFNRYFHVNAGNPILKHPLYQKYNMLTLEQIAFLNDFKGFKDLASEIQSIILTNDNMPILWYLQSIYKAATDTGMVGG
jgi:hypothetical protein